MIPTDKTEIMDTYRVGIIGGIVFGILPNLPIEDIIVTICMAIIGTLSSFLVTVFLKWVDRRIKKL